MDKKMKISDLKSEYIKEEIRASIEWYLKREGKNLILLSILHEELEECDKITFVATTKGEARILEYQFREFDHWMEIDKNTAIRSSAILIRDELYTQRS